MKSPWVSRERFEGLQRRFDELKAERDELLRMALSRPMDIPLPETAPAKEETPAAPNYGTPFDRLLGRFDAAFGHGARPPEKYRARMQ